MKNKIAVNTKYFTRTQSIGEMGHVMRLFASDKNVVRPDLSRHNFGTSDEMMKRNYESAVAAMPTSVKNSLIDSVLVLPLEQLKEVQKEHPKEWRKKINDSIISMMVEMEKEMGFKVIGYKLHLDEGTKHEDGSITLNPHAHMLFANICTQDITIQKTKKITIKDEEGKALRDPKKPSKYLYELDDTGKPRTETIDIHLKGRAPLSLHQTRGSDSIWARQQDIAAKCLKHLGFERGTSKELTQAKHLEKTAHVARELSKAEQKVESQALLIKTQEERLRAFEASLSIYQIAVDDFLSEREAFFTALTSQATNELEKRMQNALDRFESVPNVMQDQVLENTKNRINVFRDAFVFKSDEEPRALLDFMNRMEEKKVEKEALKPKPRLKF